MGLGLAWMLGSTWLAGPASADEPAKSVYQFAPVAGWVDRIEPDYRAPVPAGGGVDGEWYLLIDRQDEMRANGDDLYRHIAVKVIDSSGVAENSQFDFGVDPTYQTLLIHSLTVVRDGKVIDQRPQARITALPQETELQERVYNGGYNVNVLLSDVRVGDVVEYEYTIRSREINFPGHFYAGFSIAWSVPVLQQRIRLRYPADLPMRFRLSDGGVPPPTRTNDGMREFVLESRDLKAIPADDDRPDWSSPWPYLEATNLPDWAAVSRLAAPMYALSAPGKGVAPVVEQIRAQGGTPQQLALRALQYVQEHIRYTSIAIGPGAFRPTDPEVVFGRRFGDCKDKSLLLVTMLHALGIEADVALVHSANGRILDESLPTPYAFDHAIVRASIGPQVYWMDPTSSKQYTALSTSAPADFERALPVHGVSPTLEVIPRPSPRSGTREILVNLDLRKGLRKPGRIDIDSRYTGTLADVMRPMMNSNSREQRQTDYVNYLVKYYPGVRVRSPLTIEDDPVRNVLEVREHYEMKEPFRENDQGEIELDLHPDEVYRYAAPLDSSIRKAPLAIPFPAHVRQVITVQLPERWNVEPGVVKVENPAFRYRSQVAYSAHKLTLTYVYTSLTDTVEPHVLEKYIEDRKKVYDDLGYKLTKPIAAKAERAQFSVAPVPFLALVIALALGIWTSLRWILVCDPEPPEMPPDAPAGIRGWLLLPALQVVLLPVALAVSAVVWARFVGNELWTGLPDSVMPEFRAYAKPGLLAILAAHVVLCCWTAAAAFLFFRKRSSVPRVFVASLWIVSIVASGVLALQGLTGFQKDFSLGGFFATFARDMIGVVVWTAYMLQSKRVRATFRVRRADGRPSGNPAPGSGEGEPGREHVLS